MGALDINNPVNKIDWVYTLNKKPRLNKFVLTYELSTKNLVVEKRTIKNNWEDEKGYSLGIPEYWVLLKYLNLPKQKSEKFWFKKINPCKICKTKKCIEIFLEEAALQSGCKGWCYKADFIEICIKMWNRDNRSSKLTKGEL